MKTKVYIALSGGVDSSVAAALLKKEGYICTGVHFQLFNDQSTQPKAGPPMVEIFNKKSAQNICKHLNIPFKLYDFRKEFQKIIIKNFIEEYKKGRTPNPCVLCNEQIKFGLFFDRAMKEGADFIATGHYVRKASSKLQMANSTQQIVYSLLKAKDKAKDQSYFLYRLTQKQLAKSLFPVGKYTKEEVRRIAKKMKLPTVKIKESQDICFLAGQKAQEFLKKYLKAKKGKIVNKKGEVLGNHNGYFNFTLGQRAGIGGGTAYYVVEINAKENKIVVAKGSYNKYLFKKEIVINEVHWIRKPKVPLECEVAVRYTHKLSKARLIKKQNKYIIKFQKPERAPTPGQSAVVYKDQECLGGGVIC